MAPLATSAGLEVVSQWFSPEGAVFSLFILLLLCTFLTALCTNCGRHSFELRQNEVERTPSSLIRVVKLEDALAARENPMINEIISDEKGRSSENSRPVVIEIGPGVDNPAFTMPTSSLTEQDEAQISNGTPASLVLRDPSLVAELLTDEAQISNGTPASLVLRDPSLVAELLTDDINDVQVNEHPLAPEPTSVLDVEIPVRSASPFPAPPDTLLDALVLSELDPEEKEVEMISPPEQFGPTDMLGEDDLAEELHLEAPPVERASAHIYDTIGQKESDGEQLDVEEAAEQAAEEAAVEAAAVAAVEAAVEADISELEENSLANGVPPPLLEEDGVPNPLLLLDEEENDLGDRGWNPMYARISRKKDCPTPPPIPPPEDPEESEEDIAPPLPDRITDLE